MIMEQKIILSSSSAIHTHIRHQDLAAQGRALFNQGKPAQAQQLYVRALLLDPQNKRYKSAFVNCLPHINYRQFNPSVRKAIFLCLNDPDIMHRKISNSWLEQVVPDPEMAPLINLFSCDNYKAFKKSADFDVLPQSLNNEFFLAGFKKCLLMDLQFEPLVIYLRRFYLLEASEEQKKEARLFLFALATKCFNNEYIYSFSNEEQTYVETLRKNKKLSLEDTVLLGCYVPLYTLDKAGELSALRARSENSEEMDLIQLQIDEPLEERKILQTIESFSPVKNDVSNNVQAQYEEHPYPRWVSCMKPGLNAKQQQQSVGRDVLIAGCGTGHEAVLTSVQMPNAAIDAIDLSKNSLSYAIRKSQSHKLKNIRFLQGDILDLKVLDKFYDLIFSSGVLHHMENPAAGLKVLRDILKPGGVTSISLYSEIGRRHIAVCQQWVKDQGYVPTTEGMRQFRLDIMAMEDTNPLKKIAHISDFYSASECRDLIFHVQEHRFTCLRLKEMIESLDLILLHFGTRVLQVRNKYHQHYPEDPKGINLQNWHEFETQNPQSFILMYDLVLGRQAEHEPGVQPDWLQTLGIFKR